MRKYQQPTFSVGVRPELVIPTAGVLRAVVVATVVGGEGDLFVARAH